MKGSVGVGGVSRGRKTLCNPRLRKRSIDDQEQQFRPDALRLIVPQERRLASSVATATEAGMVFHAVVSSRHRLPRRPVRRDLVECSCLPRSPVPVATGPMKRCQFSAEMGFVCPISRHPSGLLLSAPEILHIRVCGQVFGDGAAAGGSRPEFDHSPAEMKPRLMLRRRRAGPQTENSC